MKSVSIKNEIILHISRLPTEQQLQVLNFTRALEMTKPKGIQGKSLLAFAGGIKADDLALMRQVIEEGCEKVDVDKW